VHLKLQIEKLKREIYGQRSERSARLLDQMELQLEELEATATEDELAAEKAAAKTTNVAAFSRRRSSRKPFAEHLPRERVIVPGPKACACCGGAKLSKLGEAGQGSGGGAAGMDSDHVFALCTLLGFVFAPRISVPLRKVVQKEFAQSIFSERTFSARMGDLRRFSEFGLRP
jgi:hypothetical protein